MVDNFSVDLSSWTIIKISGTDVIEYLDGLVPNNLQNIGVERSLMLTPKAKIQVVMWLMKTKDEFFMFVPPSMKDILISLLLKFKLSMDVKLEDVTDDLDPLYLLPSEQYIPGLGNFKFAHQSIPPHNCKPYDELVSILPDFGEMDPGLYLTHNPFEFGFGDSVYLPKGCFMGQEPLSRMFNIGRPRTFLYHIVSEKVLESLTLDGQIIGEIIVVGKNALIGTLKSSLSDFENFKIQNNIKEISRVGTYPGFKRT